jgi:HAD superfamily hydrolase (TIGR01662 family)
MKFKAVLFDLGSTLIEYENHDWPTLGKMGLAEGYPYIKKIHPEAPEPDIFAQSFYGYLRDILDSRAEDSEINLYDACNEIFRKMNLAMIDGQIEKFTDYYYAPVTRQITVIPYAPEILQKLKNGGQKIGLVSNTIFPEKFHREEMNRFGLLKYFEFTIFSSTVGIRKPAREIFELALKKAGVDSTEAIFVGDRYDADIAGAKRAGMVTVWKHREQRENPDNIEPDYSIMNLDELGTIILG